MKICEVSFFAYERGGLETFFLGFIRKLLEEGHEVSVFCSGKPPSDIQKKCKVHSCGNELLNKVVGFYGIFNLIAVLKMLYICLFDRPDIFHFHNPGFFSSFIFIPPKILRIPIVFTVHDYSLCCPRKEKAFVTKKRELCKKYFCSLSCFGNCLNYSPKDIFLFIRMKLFRFFVKKHVNVLVAPSNDLRMHLKKLFPESKIITIRNFIELKMPRIKTKKKRYVLFVGRLSEEKGIDFLLDAWEKVNNILPNYKLLICGDGPLRSKLQKIVQEKKIKNVSFLGFIEKENLLKLYQQARCLVVPSYWAENCPMVIYEAYNFNLPCVVSNIFGVKELVMNGKTGYLWKSRKTEELAKKIILTVKFFNKFQKQISQFKNKLLGRGSFQKYILLFKYSKK